MDVSRVARVAVYATSWCPFCAAARLLLEGKRVEFVELDIDAEPGRREEMLARSGRRTVPQIFIDDKHVGGYEDLVALDRSGQLDGMLQISSLVQKKGEGL